MRERTLVGRSLVHYWRAHLAVVLGVATAAAVLGGALVVGDSVRESLARTALERLGRATHAVEAPRFFREDLASDLLARPAFQSTFTGAAPLVALDGVASHATTGRRAGDVRVYGVDERFWAFQGLADAGARPRPRGARERGARGGARLRPRRRDPGAPAVGRRHPGELALRPSRRPVAGAAAHRSRRRAASGPRRALAAAPLVRGEGRLRAAPRPAAGARPGGPRERHPGVGVVARHAGDGARDRARRSPLPRRPGPAPAGPPRGGRSPARDGERARGRRPRPPRGGRRPAPGTAGERAPRVPREHDDRRGPRGAVLARRRPRPGSARGRGGPRRRRREPRASPRSSSTTGPPRASARPRASGSSSTTSSGTRRAASRPRGPSSRSSRSRR